MKRLESSKLERSTGYRLSDVVERVREAAARVALIDDAAPELAALIRRESGRRWIGIYRVTNGLVVNLAWSRPAAPAHPTYPVGDGPTGAAIAARASVCSNDVANDPMQRDSQG